MLTKHPWIKEDRQFFGRPQTDYDFEARDPAAAQSRLKGLMEEQASLSKKVRYELVRAFSPQFVLCRWRVLCSCWWKMPLIRVSTSTLCPFFSKRENVER